MPACASSWSTSGRPKASPTISRMLTFSRSMVRQMSSGSRPTVSSWMQIVLPLFMALNASQWPAPCMNGGAGSRRGAAVAGRVHDLLDALELAAGAEVPPAERADVDVGLAPQHALGHAGGAAGVEDVEVVGAALDVGALGARGGQRVLVPLRAGQQVGAGAVVHLEEHA